MQRLFVALDLPELARDALSQLQWGLDEALWRDPEGFHLTLAFLGEIDGPTLEETITHLSEVEAPAFSLKLSGIGCFGGIEPRSLWAGLKPCSALDRLQKKIVHRLRREGHDLGHHKFAPHVTLASVRNEDRDSVHRFAASHGLFQFGPFPVNAFHLYESLRGKSDARYEIVASFALDEARNDQAHPVKFGQNLG